MAKEKVTITLDRSKADTVRALLGAASTSEAIDVALDRLIKADRLLRDVVAYRRIPPTEEEIALAHVSEWDDLHDDTDWEAVFAENGR
ncbi:MAG TPA: hypothetical protein VF157_05040 [Chloroflexota bacterium]